MRLTVAFITGRAEPHLDWLLESLAPQVSIDDEIDILAVDARGRTPDDLGARPAYGHWEARVRVTAPKPTVWSGPHRVTSCDWWSKSNAINTAITLCEADYVAFCDDSCRLGPRWLETVRGGGRERASVLAGSYDKLERGRVTVDHRVGIAPRGKIDCGPGWLFGCTYALPLAWMLEINGAEEGVDGMGAEDGVMGMHLANAGRRIDFVPEMAVHQERPEVSTLDGSGAAVRRTDKGQSPHDKSHRALDIFATRRRTDPRFTPDLRDLRARIARGEPWPEPVWALRDASGRPLDWFDSQPIESM